MPGNPSAPLPVRFALAGARAGIDRIDDAMIVLLAARRKFVDALGSVKRAAHAPARDVEREGRVRERARQVAARLGVPSASADQLTGMLIADACEQQQTTKQREDACPPRAMNVSRFQALLRWIPPPRYWRRPAGLVPPTLRDAVAERVLTQALGETLRGDWMDPVRHRRVGIELTDLGLAWVLEVQDDRLVRSHAPAETVVRGSVTDMLLLSSRLEDADTLFFQRRLTLTGNVELGLTVRNLLDRMPWEAFPLAVRIALHRSARMLRAARDAHPGTH